MYREVRQGTQEQQPVVTCLLPRSPLVCWLTYRSSSKACCTSRKASASRLLMSSFRYRAMKGIVFSSWKRRIKFAHTHGSTSVISDKACQRREKTQTQQPNTFKRDGRFLQTASQFNIQNHPQNITLPSREYCPPQDRMSGFSYIQPLHPVFQQDMQQPVFPKTGNHSKNAGSTSSWEKKRKKRQGRKNQNYKTKQKDHKLHTATQNLIFFF